MTKNSLLKIDISKIDLCHELSIYHNYFIHFSDICMVSNLFQPLQHWNIFVWTMDTKGFFQFNPFKSDFTLSSSSTTSLELLSQFSTCSGWRWFDVGEKVKKIAMYR